MITINPILVKLGAIIGFLSVSLGAFGAHILENIIDSASLEIFETGVRYEFYHGLVILFIGLLDDVNNKKLIRAGQLFFGGIILFSGSLYLIALTGVTILGIITPFGGVA